MRSASALVLAAALVDVEREHLERGARGRHRVGEHPGRHHARADEQHRREPRRERPRPPRLEEGDHTQHDEQHQPGHQQLPAERHDLHERAAPIQPEQQVGQYADGGRRREEGGPHESRGGTPRPGHPAILPGGVDAVRRRAHRPAAFGRTARHGAALGRSMPRPVASGRKTPQPAASGRSVGRRAALGRSTSRQAASDRPSAARCRALRLVGAASGRALRAHGARSTRARSARPLDGLVQDVLTQGARRARVHRRRVCPSRLESALRGPAGWRPTAAMRARAPSSTRRRRYRACPPRARPCPATTGR